MKKFLPLFLAFFLFSGATFAAGISIKDVLNEPNKFTEEVILVEGEAIGEILKNREGFWINILSQGYNMGIFSGESEPFENISYWGSFKEKGDYIRVRGTFYENCPLHKTSGLHMESLGIIKKGHKMELSVSLKKQKAAVRLFVIFLITAFIYFIKTRMKH